MTDRAVSVDALPRVADAARAAADASVPATADDSALAQRCLAGDDQAWHTLYQRLKPVCRHIAHKYDLLPAFDELYSDFMLKLVGSSQHDGVLGRYSGRAALKTYLLVVFANVVLDFAARQRHTDHLFRSLDQLPRSAEPGSSPDAESENPRSAAVYRAICQLPASERLLLEWHYYHGKSLAAIAAAFDLNAATVGRRLKLILAKLGPALTSLVRSS